MINSTLNDVLSIAAGEIGYSRWNDPLEGTKYGRWYADVTGEGWAGGNDIAYCVMFISWIFAQAGQPEPFLPSQNCDDVVNRAWGYGIGIDEACEGDLLIFDWGDGGIRDHIGLIESVNDDGTFNTIEGNTLNGRVARRVRGRDCVCDVIRPDYAPYEMTGWVYDGDNDAWGYRTADGTLLASRWWYDNGEWYWFDANGVMVTGYHQINGKWYVFDDQRPNRGRMFHDRPVRYKGFTDSWCWLGDDGAALMDAPLWVRGGIITQEPPPA